MEADGTSDLNSKRSFGLAEVVRSLSTSAKGALSVEGQLVSLSPLLANTRPPPSSTNLLRQRLRIFDRRRRHKD